LEVVVVITEPTVQTRDPAPQVARDIPRDDGISERHQPLYRDDKSPSPPFSAILVGIVTGFRSIFDSVRRRLSRHTNLAERDRNAFLAVMQSPPKPGQKLRAGAARYQQARSSGTLR